MVTDASPAPLLPASLHALEGMPFTTRSAREAGVDAHHLQALHQTGRLRRLIRGVHVAATVPDSLDLRIRALGLIAPADAVVCDRHAAWLHGADMVLAPGEHIEARPLRVLRRRGSHSLRCETPDCLRAA